MRQAFRDSRGITLVELLVVISIVSILALALAFSYRGWTGRYKVEDQVKQLYADMLYAKNTAVERSRDYFMKFPVSGSGSSAVYTYTIYEDTYTTPAGNGVLDDTGGSQDTVLAGYPKKLDYQLSGYRDTLDYSTNPATVSVSPAIGVDTVTITFDKGGFMSCGQLFPAGTNRGVIKFTDTDNPDVASDYDCILISQTSLDMGKWNDTSKICSIK